MLVIFFKMNHTDMTDNHIAKMIYFRMVVVERERGGEQKIERVIDRERETKKNNLMQKYKHNVSEMFLSHLHEPCCFFN